MTRQVLTRDGNMVTVAADGVSQTVLAPSSHVVRMGVADEALVLSMLSDISARPGVYVLRELWSNAVDAQRKAGTLDGDHPIKVSIERAGSSDALGIVARMLEEPDAKAHDVSALVVEDHGCGMTGDELVGNFLQYGGSDKRDDPDAIGSKGLGAKAPLAIADGFTVRTTKDGVTTTAVVTRPASGMPEATVTSRGTALPDGTCVEVAFADADGGIAESMRSYAKSMADVLEAPILELDGHVVEPRLPTLVRKGDWVRWEAADGVTIYEQVRGQHSSVAGIVPNLPWRDIEFPSVSTGYTSARHNLSNCSVAIFGERYELPHFASHTIGDTCVACIEPGFLDFDPSRDNVVDDVRTRDFEAWLQAAVYDHLHADDNEGERRRVAEIPSLWEHNVVSATKGGDGTWEVGLCREMAGYRVPTGPIVRLHYGKGDDFSNILDAASRMSSDVLARMVRLDETGSYARDIAASDVFSFARIQGMTRSRIRRLDFGDVRQDGLGQVCYVKRDDVDLGRWLIDAAHAILLARRLTHGFSSEGAELGDGRIPVIPEAWLADVVKASPNLFLGIAVEGDASLADEVASLAPETLCGPGVMRPVLDEALSYQASRRRARSASAGRTASKPDRVTVAKDGLRGLECAARSGAAVVLNGAAFGKAGVPIELVAYRVGSLSKNYMKSHAADAAARVMSMERVLHPDVLPCVVAAPVSVDVLMKLACSDDVRLIATYGFSDATMRRLSGLRVSELAGIVSVDPYVHLDAGPLVRRFGHDKAVEVAIASGAIPLSSWMFLVQAKALVPDLELPDLAEAAVESGLASFRDERRCYESPYHAALDDPDGILKDVSDEAARVNERWYELSVKFDVLGRPSKWDVDPSNRDVRDIKPAPWMAPVIEGAVRSLFSKEGTD